jgi:hypothetical protein
MLLFELFGARNEALSFVDVTNAQLSLVPVAEPSGKLPRLNTLVIIPSYGMRGAAFDLEARITKSGFISAQLEDPFNLLHGRYMIFSERRNRGGRNSTKAVMIARLGEEKHLELINSNLPQGSLCSSFVSTQPGLVGSGEGLMHSILLFGTFLAAFQTNPSWKLLAWGNDLFQRDNFSLYSETR